MVTRDELVELLGAMSEDIQNLENEVRGDLLLELEAISNTLATLTAMVSNCEFDKDFIK